MFVSVGQRLIKTICSEPIRVWHVTARAHSNPSFNIIPAFASRTTLCRFHRDICASIHQLVQDLDAQNRPQYIVSDQPGQNAAQLRNGVSQCCYICITFWSRATQSYRHGVETNNLHPPHNQDGVVNGYAYHVLSSLEMEDHVSINRRIEMFVYYESRLASGRKIIGRAKEYVQGFKILPAGDVCAPDGVEFAKNTKPEATGEQINEWLRICMKSHDKCKKPPARRGHLPSRLVAVEHDNIKVKYSANIDSSENYVALSYCWGKKSTLMLTDSDDDPLYSGIPLSKLPKTFIDAIHATRAMGKKYIWIDSLCLVQVPKHSDEWKSEAAHMGDIYAKAWCTIAATHGTDNKAGCFVKRNPLLLQYPSYDSPVGSNYHNDQQFYIIDSTLWDSAITNAPLNRRGWVLQERLLSPRIVHFCAEQVFWECVELVACESFPNGTPEKLMGQRPDGKRIPQNEFKVYLNETLQTSSDAYDRWNVIVEEYSRRDALTEPTDKFVAISGVARKLQRTIIDQYVAGLWSDHLPHGLAWSRAGYDLGKRPGGPYVAPSWSWASLEGEVEFLGKFESWDTMTDVIDFTTTPPNSPFGPLDSATITLRGPLLDLTVVQDDQRTSPRRVHPGWIKLQGRVWLLGDLVTWDDRPLAQFVGVRLHFTPSVWEQSRGERERRGCGFGLGTFQWKDEEGGVTVLCGGDRGSNIRGDIPGNKGYGFCGCVKLQESFALSMRF